MGNRILARCGGTGLLLATFAFAAPALAAAAHSASATVPAGLRPALYSALAQDAGPTDAIGKNGCATLPEQKLTACFEKGGVQFSGKDAPALALHLAAWGRDDKLARVAPVAPQIAGNRARYAHGDVTEWWRVLPMGFEQGFTVAKRPAGAGELVLVLAAGRKAQAHGAGAAWGKLRYGKLVVTDAGGHVVPARIETRGKRVLIAVNDAHAAYPLTVDPLVWIRQELTASDGVAGDDFGDAVAVFGKTALVGAQSATVNGQPQQGAVYVFTRAQGVWSQTQKLVASDGSHYCWFGSSVALYGRTALVGAPNTPAPGSPNAGAVYVFTRSGGTWTQTQKLVATNGSEFGTSLALVGSTALIGSPGTTSNGRKPYGAAFVFTRANGTWSQQQELVPLDSKSEDAGVSVALDGERVAFFGAPKRGHRLTGLVYVYMETNGTWRPWTALAASGYPWRNEFGQAIAPLGNTVLIGAPDDMRVYAFTESGGNWVQTEQIAVAGAPGRFGYSIAKYGTRAIIGAPGWSQGTPGAAYIFTDADGSWTQSQKLTADIGPVGVEDAFGSSVAYGRGGVFAGAPGAMVNGHRNQGAAYFFRQGDLALAVSAPGGVRQGQEYTSQTIVTNQGSAAAPVTETIAVPAAVSVVGASASQGSCQYEVPFGTRMLKCALGSVAGNGTTASVNVTFKPSGQVGETIENRSSVANATPALTASAPTAIQQSGCAAGYSEYDGTLAGGARAIEPNGQPYQAPAGEENGVLTAPSGFRLAVAYHGASGGWHVYPAPGGELHHQGPAGRYAWIVKAGATGGAYTFCLKHP